MGGSGGSPKCVCVANKIGRQAGGIQTSVPRKAGATRGAGSIWVSLAPNLLNHDSSLWKFISKQRKSLSSFDLNFPHKYF